MLRPERVLQADQSLGGFGRLGIASCLGDCSHCSQVIVVTVIEPFLSIVVSTIQFAMSS